MPIMRNPFRKNPADHVLSENDVVSARSSLDGGLARPDSQPLASRTNSQQSEPVEYKLSEINDSGVYLPPSPTEKKSFWSMRSGSSTNTYRSNVTDNDAFTISRESFDSYRRSFDISARSPVSRAESTRTRHSLDTRRARLPAPAMPLRDSHFNPPESQPEDRFEDIGLNDDVAAKPKKHGFMARFGGSSGGSGNGSSGAGVSQHASTEPGSRPSSSHHGLGVFGRKRAASGQGQELATVPTAQLSS